MPKLLIPLLFAASFIPTCGKKDPAAAGGKPPGMMGTPEVSTLTIQPQRVEITTELTGRISASQTAEVRPQVSGIIQNRLFTEGTDVKAGDALYQIDPATYQAVFDGAKASLAKAEANLAPIALKAKRYEELHESDAISEQDYDESKAAQKLAEAEILSAKAALENARINLAYTKVTAPISGRIGRSAVTNGALVTAGQPSPLATIQQLDPVYVDVTQSSTELLLLSQAKESGSLSTDGNSAKVSLKLDDGSTYSEPGTLKFSEAFVDEGTGSVTLRTLFPNPKGILLPGMFARTVLAEGFKENGILVPQRAVSRDPMGHAMVMLVGAEEKVEPRILNTSRTIGDNWLIESGLNPGDRVIMEGTQRARPGTPVKAVPFVASQPHALPGQPAPAAKPAAAPGSSAAPATSEPAAAKNPAPAEKKAEAATPPPAALPKQTQN